MRTESTPRLTQFGCETGTALGFNLRTPENQLCLPPPPPRRQHTQTSAPETRSNSGSCSSLGSHPRCPWSQAASAGTPQLQAGLGVSSSTALSWTIFNLLSFNEASRKAALWWGRGPTPLCSVLLTGLRLWRLSCIPQQPANSFL